MTKLYVVLTILSLSGCASWSLSNREKKQEHVLDCVKTLRDEDADTSEAFEVCRQVYQLKKVKE